MIVFKQMNDKFCYINPKYVESLFELKDSNGTRICFTSQEYVDVDVEMVKVAESISFMDKSIDLAKIKYIMFDSIEHFWNKCTI